MNAREANVFLTKAALLDPRMKRVNTIEQADMASMWAEVLEDVPLDVALAALRKHYRSAAVPIMPANVLELAGVADDVPDTWRDYTPEIIAASKARALAAAGVTEAELDEHAHDVAWLRAKFPGAFEQQAIAADENGEPE